VGRHPVFGLAVHLVGTNLEFNRLALRTQHRGVQRLVEVELRHRDVVLEPPWQRVPADMECTQRGIAIAWGLDQHSQPNQVIDLLEVAAPNDHLLVDRVIVLRPAGDRGLDLGRVQVGVHLIDDLLQELIAAGRGLGDHPDDLVVDLWLQGGEGQILELPFDGVHAQAVGERGEDLQRLGRDS
jgi:hypothetical protein